MQRVQSIKKNSILLSNLTNEPIHYHVGKVTSLVSNNKETKNTIVTDLTKKFINKDNYGYLFSLQVNNRKQSNLEGTAAFEDKLNFLQRKLILYCNDNGRIINVVNIKQIKEDWYYQKKEIKKEFKKIIPEIDKILTGAEELLEDNDAFIDLITKSEIGTLLFPPIYKQELLNAKQIKQQKTFSQFFDDYALPLSLKTTLLESSKAINHQIIRSGNINSNEFKSAEIKRFFRKLYNAQDLAIDIDVAYLETYDLGSYNTIYSATQMMGVEIKDLYRYRQISKLKKITHV